MLRISNLTLRRGAKVLFSAASMTVHPGQKVGLVGPNGSGKSSLFALVRGELHAGLGFAEESQRRPVAEFSGGWRMRLNLARALMCRSDLLLLDEPTNHLDLDAVLWLEDWLKAFPGAVILITHDREFLDAAAEEIVHVEHRRLHEYSGNYSAFELQRAERLAQQQAAYEKQQKTVAHLEAFISRLDRKSVV